MPKDAHILSPGKWCTCWNQHHTFFNGKYVNGIEEQQEIL